MKFGPTLPTILAAGLMCAVAVLRADHPVPQNDSRPKPTLWAWERQEDLSFLNPEQFEIAYFAGRVYLGHDDIVFRPRLNRLLVPPKTRAYPVFRIESSDSNNRHSKICSRQLVELLENYQRSHGNHSLQLDFDAVESERPFFIEFLKSLRDKLKPGTHICITALSSWCIRDRWLQSAAVDEAVAMLFSLGPNQDTVMEAISRDGLATGSTKTLLSVGISTRETTTNRKLKNMRVLNNHTKVYLFSSLPWTAARVARAVQTYREIEGDSGCPPQCTPSGG